MDALNRDCATTSARISVSAALLNGERVKGRLVDTAHCMEETHIRPKIAAQAGRELKAAQHCRETKHYQIKGITFGGRSSSREKVREPESRDNRP